MEKYISIISDIITSVAILLGGIWAFWRFVIYRENAWNLQMTLDAKFFPYCEEKKLLHLKVKLKNIGKTGIAPGKKGCPVSIKKIHKNKDIGELIHWEDGEYLLKEYDVIGNRGGAELIPDYYIEPGCEYIENVWIPVSDKQLLMVESRFWWKTNDQCISAYEIIEPATSNP